MSLVATRRIVFANVMAEVSECVEIISKQIYYGGDYKSDFEDEETETKQRQKRNDLAVRSPQVCISKPNKQAFVEECSREQGRIQQAKFLALDVYTRHKKLINEYILCYPGSTSKLRRDTSKDKTDHDAILENHKFLWDEGEEADTWEKQLSKKYYDKLFKEYCITDLSRYKENKIAMRWRMEQEVIDGKGQFFCGSVLCTEKIGLRSWEVNFGYMEHGEKKNALVKLRLCPDCSSKLNFHHRRKEIKRNKRRLSGDKDFNNKKRKRGLEGNEASSELPVSSSEESSLTSRDAIDEHANNMNIWNQPPKEVVEVSKDEEFEDYLADMLL